MKQEICGNVLLLVCLYLYVMQVYSIHVFMQACNECIHTIHSEGRVSHEKNTVTFHCTSCLIGILIIWSNYSDLARPHLKR